MLGGGSLSGGGEIMASTKTKSDIIAYNIASMAYNILWRRRSIAAASAGNQRVSGGISNLAGVSTANSASIGKYV